jgi:hypothetical protein
MLRHFSSTCIWSIYISQLIRYSRVCGCYRNFLDRGLLLTRKLLNQGFLLDKLQSSLGMCYGWHLRSTCVTNDHRYVPFVVITIWAFPHPWLITGFVNIETWRVPLVEHDLLTLKEHLSSFLVFSGDRVARGFFVVFCRLFFILSLCCLSFDLRILITHWVLSFNNDSGNY